MSLVSRVTNILTSPKTEWPVIAAEGASIGSLYTGYILPLTAIPAIAGLLPLLILSPSALAFGIIYAIISYLLALVLTFAVAFLGSKLAPSFGGRDDLVQSLKLLAYSYTAAWVAGVLDIIPVAGGYLAFFAGLYWVYLLFLGAGPVLGVPQDKSVVYTLVVFVIQLVLYGIVFLITSIIVGILIVAVLGASGALTH